jgi:hypothetical protein
VGQSTPKPYQYKQVCDRLDQQERERTRIGAAIMKEDTTIDN